MQFRCIEMIGARGYLTTMPAHAHMLMLCVCGVIVLQQIAMCRSSSLPRDDIYKDFLEISVPKAYKSSGRSRELPHRAGDGPNAPWFWRDLRADMPRSFSPAGAGELSEARFGRGLRDDMPLYAQFYPTQHKRPLQSMWASRRARGLPDTDGAAPAVGQLLRVATPRDVMYAAATATSGSASGGANSGTTGGVAALRSIYTPYNIVRRLGIIGKRSDVVDVDEAARGTQNGSTAKI